MMNQNPNANTMPCYKIVHSDGRLGGFGLGAHDKIRRLKNDNISVKDGKIVDFEHHLFTTFQTIYPLKKLQQEQISIACKVNLHDTFNEVKTIAGIDVAYPKNEFEPAAAACVVMDIESKETLESVTHCQTPLFPYISSYLSYRELPLLTPLIQKLSIKPSLFLVDGNGILHPRNCGLATHFGIAHNIPTVGVAKIILFGSIKNDMIYVDNNKKGYAATFTSKSTKPLFISPGNNISFETSYTTVKQLCKYRIPEPLRKAHQLAQKTISSIQ